MMLSAAEHLLQELGVTEPEEIDLEAISHYVGATVKYGRLDGCEARIIGCDGRAIITVNTSSHFRRKRFSIAHELGHWHHHRGQCLACRVEDYHPRSDKLSPERAADGYAADLLMPGYLVKPLLKGRQKLDFQTVVAFADRFKTSLTAMAIRLTEQNHWPVILVCHGRHGRKWFVRSGLVPTAWFPRAELDAESFSIGVLFGNKANCPIPRKIGADAWFERRDAERFEIHEQTIQTMPGEILTILTLNSVMIDDH